MRWVKHEPWKSSDQHDTRGLQLWHELADAAQRYSEATAVHRMRRLATLTKELIACIESGHSEARMMMKSVKLTLDKMSKETSAKAQKKPRRQ